MIAYITYVLASKKLKAYEIQQKYFNHPYNNQISIIIYAHNDEKAIVALLEKLNKQNYPKGNYQVNIVLDNCTDNSSNILEFIGGAKIWRVGEDNTTLGKDSAISWTLERLISFQNVNAYVFLDVNRKIDENFLTNVNSALFDGDVLVGTTETVVTENNLINSIKQVYKHYDDKIIKTGRRFLFGGLSCLIDSDVAIIKQEVLEKIKCIDFKDVNSELKYTTLLVKNGFIPKFAPNVKTFIDVEKFEIKIPSFKRRLTLFCHCLPLIFCSNLKFTEHLFYLIRPNVLFMLALYMLFVWFTMSFISFSIFFKNIVVQLLGGLCIFSFIFSLFRAKIKKEDICYLFLYPFYHLLKNMSNYKVFSGISEKLFAAKSSVKILEKFAVDVIVSGGNKNFKCKLEIVTEDKLSKAIFTFKKKKYMSSSHLLTYEAIKEIADKLDEHGFRIKICQTCGYFFCKMENGANYLKGCCNCKKCSSAEEIDNDENEISDNEYFLWNYCEKYIPKEINNVIDISTYM